MYTSRRVLHMYTYMNTSQMLATGIDPNILTIKY